MAIAARTNHIAMDLGHLPDAWLGTKSVSNLTMAENVAAP
jgi:hypothetical protein